MELCEYSLAQEGGPTGIVIKIALEVFSKMHLERVIRYQKGACLAHILYNFHAGCPYQGSSIYTT